MVEYSITNGGIVDDFRRERTPDAIGRLKAPGTEADVPSGSDEYEIITEELDENIKHTQALFIPTIEELITLIGLSHQEFFREEIDLLGPGFLKTKGEITTFPYDYWTETRCLIGTPEFGWPEIREDLLEAIASNEDEDIKVPDDCNLRFVFYHSRGREGNNGTSIDMGLDFAASIEFTLGVLRGAEPEQVRIGFDSGYWTPEAMSNKTHWGFYKTLIDELGKTMGREITPGLLIHQLIRNMRAPADYNGKISHPRLSLTYEKSRTLIEFSDDTGYTDMIGEMFMEKVEDGYRILHGAKTAEIRPWYGEMKSLV